MPVTTVISLGGSVISPAGVDDLFLKKIFSLIRARIDQAVAEKFILVCGGGAPAREYQRAYHSVCAQCEPENADRIGIAATKLNAELVRNIFSDFCLDEVVNDPTADIGFNGRVLVASGWKPGFSTDYVAILLAEKFGAKTVVNLSNVAKAYTDDPRKNPDARPLDDISWPEFRKIVGDSWTPGKNVPFDPIASKKAHETGISVIIAAGNDLDNLRLILDGQGFFGTLIHP